MDRTHFIPSPDALRRVLVAMGARPDRAAMYAAPMAETMARYGINTPLRAMHFLAQVMHESKRLRYNVELAPGWAYEGRKDLGNTRPGDGPRFKGRGLIQLTGRSNYAQYSRSTAIDFTSQPALLAQLPHCVDVAGWFWMVRGLSKLADADDAVAVTKRINGGLNGFKDRAELLAIARREITTLAAAPEPEPRATDGPRAVQIDPVHPLPPDPMPGVTPGEQ